MSKFGTRFTRDNSSLESFIDSNDDPSDADLESRSERLRIYAKEVRRYSVILQQASTWDIYQVATRHSDPKISLVLAAAKDNDGNHQFPTEDTIKDVLFGVDPPTGIGNNDFLADGVRRVSIGLTASVLIGQLSQVEEQAEHSDTLRKEALADLDRIISLPDTAALSGGGAPENLESGNAAFFFSQTDISLNSGDELHAEIYIPSISGSSTSWSTVATYTSDLTTGTIVADIADKVNQLTLNNQTLNLLASPVLSGPSGTHFIEFYPRKQYQGIESDVVSIRFTYYDDSQGKDLETLPFKWGMKVNNLTGLRINSALVVIDGSNRTTSAVDPASGQEGYTVLYIRNKASITTTSHIIKFRVNPTDEETREIQLDDTVPNTERPSHATFRLIQKLSDLQLQTRVLGAIIRNDESTDDKPTSATRLVAFSATNPETFIVLDILEIPDDLEIALGTATDPITSFSSQPKSIRVETIYNENFNFSEQELKGKNSPVNVAKLPRSSLLDRINDETRIVTGWDYYG